MSGPTPTTAMRRRPACFISTGSVLIDLPLHVDHVPVSGGAVTAVSSGPAADGGYTVVSAGSPWRPRWAPAPTPPRCARP